jgi:dihydroorotate dehydrogenase (fumarate)
MIDLRTRYLGLELRSPIVASASPLNRDLDTARAVVDAGAGANVMPALFEEEIINEEIGIDRALEQGVEHFAEALDYFPAVHSFVHAGDRYRARLEELKGALDVPVIASLNATSPGGWAKWAGLLADSGADAIELNLYRVAADPSRSAAHIEASDLAVISSVTAAVAVPVAVKVSPYYSSLAHFAGNVIGAGAAGLVLFNRFYQPDLDLDELDVVPRLELSQPSELRLPLRWLAILRPQLGPSVSLAATSGVHAGTDVVKALMVGADVAMMTSAVLRNGAGHLAAVEAELRAWMEEREYRSSDELRGCATGRTVEDPSAFERANYLRTLHSWTAPGELTPAAPAAGVPGSLAGPH